MKNDGFIFKSDVFSLLQSKGHYLWIKLKEALLFKWYFHFKPNVFLSRDHVTSCQTALFEVEVRHCYFLTSSARSDPPRPADRAPLHYKFLWRTLSGLSVLCGNLLKQGKISKLCCFSATCVFRVHLWSVAE